MLRHRLVCVGVLPDRGEYLERVGPWLEQLLADQPAARRDLVRRYARWCVLHRARKRAVHRPITVSAGYHLRYQLGTVLELVTWLDQHGRGITVGQADIDRWIIHNPRSIHNGIRRFLAWARDRHGAPPLTVPRHPDINACPRPMDEQVATAQLRRCLHDESLPVDVRVAGAIIMLFGVRMARLVQLTIDDVTSSDGAVWLHVGRAPIRLPAPLDRLLTQLAAAPADPSPISRAVGPARYLFPGTAAGRPM